jgi:hypothetical protein
MPEREITVDGISTIAHFDGDRWYIRRTLVATLMVPIGNKEYTGVEITVIKRGVVSFAVTSHSRLIHNIGVDWKILYHIRSYRDR